MLRQDKRRLVSGSSLSMVVLVLACGGGGSSEGGENSFSGAGSDTSDAGESGEGAEAEAGEGGDDAGDFEWSTLDEYELRIHDTPAHRRGAGPVVLDELRGKAARFGVQQIGDVALLPQLDVLAPVPPGQCIAHTGEEIAQLLRLGAGEFDKFKAVGAGRIFGADHGFRGIVRERSHGASPLC